MLDANSLFRTMLSDVVKGGQLRVARDGPTTEPTLEVCGAHYVADPYRNLVTARKVNVEWATANVLHFFSGSERADMLIDVNKHAPKFLTDGRFVGAYGAVAMPQIEACVKKMKLEPYTRRAFVTVCRHDWYVKENLNIPPCISSFHFMRVSSYVDMFVHQRSLNVWGVMPYDLILLTNVLSYVCQRLYAPMGRVHWNVDSLHVVQPIGELLDRQVSSLFVNEEDITEWRKRWTS